MTLAADGESSNRPATNERLRAGDRRCGSPSPTAVIAKDAFDAVIFDLDGVVTRTAEVHAAAWKRLFDDYLRRRAEREGTEFRPFDADADYREYVDGKPRYDGVRSFLESRGIRLAEGDPGDGPDAETVCGLGNRKNAYFHEHLETHGVKTHDSTVALVRALKAHGIRTAVVSSSRNCVAVLEAAGIADLFDARVDGVDSAEFGLEGKPAPDIFLEGARRLGVAPRRAVVVEDAVVGVEAGRRGGFGLVVGVDRSGHAAALEEGGAGVVVSGLAQLRVEDSSDRHDSSMPELPSALDRLDDIAARLRGCRPAVFLDYDGTLTPIVDDPDRAFMPADMRAAVRALADRCTVAVVSGRDLATVRDFVGLDGIVYAGSHGFDIAGPEGLHVTQQKGTGFLPELDRAETTLREELSAIAGARIERKKFSIAVHYRRVAEAECGKVEEIVDRVLSDHGGLRKGRGKKVYEVQPAIEWNKGEAIRWLLEALGLDTKDVLPLYIGDDVTDEDAFRALGEDGVGILVADAPQPTAAHYVLRDPDEVRAFLERLTMLLKGGRS